MRKLLFVIMIIVLCSLAYAEDINLKDFLLSPGNNVSKQFNFTGKIGNNVDIKLSGDPEAMQWMNLPRNLPIMNGIVSLDYSISVPNNANIGNFPVIISMTDNAGTDNYKINIQVARPFIKFIMSYILFIGILIIIILMGVAVWLFKDVTKK
jgi:hypothetical protein